MRVCADALRRFVSAVFVKQGSNQQEADSIAEHLVKENLVGHDSHGVIRTHIYIGWLHEGKVFANRSLTVIFEAEALALCDAHLGYGQAIGKQVVEMGLAKCAAQGASVIALRNSGHLGQSGSRGLQRGRSGNAGGDQCPDRSADRPVAHVPGTTAVDPQ